MQFIVQFLGDVDQVNLSVITFFNDEVSLKLYFYNAFSHDDFLHI